MEGDVRFHHLVPGVWVLEARRCANRWVVFHETYSFCLAETVPAPVAWKYRRNLHVVDREHVVMAMQPGELHANVQRTPPADFIVLQIREAVMKAVAAELGAAPGALNIRPLFAGHNHPDMARALTRVRRGLCATLYDDTDRGGGVCTCGQRSDEHDENLSEVVAAFLAHYAEEEPRGTAFLRGAAVIRKAVDYLRDNYARPYRLDRLAAAAGCGKYYLSHLFKQEVGVSPSEYQNKILVAKSWEALARTPDLALDAIAREAGWPGRRQAAAETDRVSLMIRHFRRTLGVTPGQFRAGLRELGGWRAGVSGHRAGAILPTARRSGEPSYRRIAIRSET